MANNIFVSYDLHTPGQNYEAVIAEIKANGDWAKVHYSLFYLSSSKTAEQVAKSVWSKMDANDKLIVVDASKNDAYWYNLSDEIGRYLQNHWRS